MQSVRKLWRKVRLRRTKSASRPHQDASDFDHGYQFQSSSEGTCDEYSLPDPSPKDEEIVSQSALRLPLDVITIILEYLDARTLVTCRETCRLLHRWIDGTALLRYKIELAVAGMDNGPPSNLSVSERLKLLREHQTAWRTLSWNRCQHIPEIETPWQCVGGILAFLSPFPSQSVLFKQLPSIMRGIEEREWTVDFPFTIDDFAVDPAQDLLVVVTAEHESFCSVVSCALSSGATHPLAFGPLEHRGTQYFQGTLYHIEIFKNLVAVQHVLSDHLMIWDWKTGQTKLDISGETSGYAILSERYILITTVPDDEPTPVLNIHDLSFTLTGSGLLLCSLQFPALRDHQELGYCRFSVRCDLTPGQTSHPSRTVPFSPSQDDRLYVIQCNSDSDSVPTLVLFVPLSTFMAAIDASQIGEARHTLTWDEWGGTGTCMLHLRPSFAWVTYVHAMKFAMIWKRQIKIFDFNQYSFKYDRLREGPKPRTVLTSSIFRERIPSSLDYRIRAARIPDSLNLGPSLYRSVLLTEDSLIIIPDESECVIFTF